MSTKFIVTNLAALTAKYGPGGTQSIVAAVGSVIAADAARALTTTLVDLSDAAQMAHFGAAPIAANASPADNKAAIDAVANWVEVPDYLMLLGGPDVIPHQPLVNPTPGDGDAQVDSDLPYACTAGYSLNIGAFLAPSRVVGRLPDVVGATSPDVLLDLLDRLLVWQSSPPAAYSNYFALTAKAWVASTQLSLTNVFGSSASLFISPPDPPAPWAPGQLAPLAHFVNCHGGTIDPRWYGDPGFPIAMDSGQVRGKFRAGTVATAECCYGAELYDPNAAPSPGICMSYLEDGAYAFFGSTTIAYGPAVGNSAADLITQYFMANVLAGASTGRAALDARLKYVTVTLPLSPVDLKTLGQFILLGDPSIHPVVLPVVFKSVSPPQTATLPAGASLRRTASAELSSSLSRTASYASASIEGSPPGVRERVEAIARDLGIEKPLVETHGIVDPAAMGGLSRTLPPGVLPKSLTPDTGRFHVVYPANQVQAQPKAGSKSKENIGEPAAKGLARLVVFREIGGQVVDYQELWCHG